MDVREILATNLKALMESRPEVNSLPLMEAATRTKGCRVSKTALGQVQNKKTPFNLDGLQACARVFGLDAWQLLVPGLRPEKPPVLRSVGVVEDDFYARARELAKHLAALPERDK